MKQNGFTPHKGKRIFASLYAWTEEKETSPQAKKAVCIEGRHPVHEASEHEEERCVSCLAPTRT
eukprot:164180-Pelagomonas_calceolata.AAC.3